LGDREDFFDQLFNETTPAAEDIKALRQLAYEERVIKRVFTECGIRPNSWGRLANDCRDKTEQVKLNFGWFNATYNGFPARLLGRRVPYLHKITLLDLFKPVPKNRLVKAIAKELAFNNVDIAKDGYVFVFPIVKTAFCAHSLGKRGEERPVDGFRPQFVLRPAGDKRLLIVEPLKTLCNAIGAEWYSV
jgi:hypothetical protein